MATVIRPDLLTDQGSVASSGLVLTAVSASSMQWLALPTTIATATNLAGGVVGDIAIQTSAGVTTFLAPSANTGYVLTSTGSSTAPTWQAAAVPVALAIGTILETPSAPTGFGTWLACDGSSVSQSTYATLFSDIGHGYMGYTYTVPNTGITAFGNTNPGPIWNGTYFCYLTSATNMNYTAGTGTIASTTVTSSSSIIAYGTQMLMYGASTTANYSSNSGVSVAANTLPIAATSNRIASGNSTTSFLYVVPSSQAVYTMAAGGSTWTTTATGLSGTLGANVGPTWWDGTNWNIIDVTNFKLYQTTVAAGTSGWGSTVITTANAFNVNVATFITLANAPNVVCLFPVTGVALVSSNSLLTCTQYGINAPQGATGLVALSWNGFCYIIESSTSGGTPFALFVSANGKDWRQSANAGVLFTYGPNFNAPGLNSNSTCDTATGRFIGQCSAAGSTTNLVLATPTPTLATQFSLPNKPYHYIRAL